MPVDDSGEPVKWTKEGRREYDRRYQQERRDRGLVKKHPDHRNIDVAVVNQYERREEDKMDVVCRVCAHGATLPVMLTLGFNLYPIYGWSFRVVDGWLCPQCVEGGNR